jgi:hypothetical protein
MGGEDREHTGAAREASKERGGSWRRCRECVEDGGGVGGERDRESLVGGTIFHKGSVC